MKPKTFWPAISNCGRRSSLYILSVLTLGFIAVLALFAVIVYDEDPIVFQSEESSSPEVGPIYNRTSWRSFKNQDIWIMQQSQKGFNKDFESWDRLAIVVNKTKTPLTAEFIQTTPGKIDFSGHYKSIDFKVPCGICHTNGPRAIRPVLNSEIVPVSLKDRFKIYLWNLRIRKYARIKSSATTHLTGLPRTVPFKFDGDFAEKHLNVRTCNKCHNNSSQGRGKLQRQNLPTIRFMVEKGYMPPSRISDIDREQLNQILSSMSGTKAN